MIILHRGKDARDRVRKLAAPASERVFSHNADQLLEDSVPRLAEWLANTDDPSLIVIDPAEADNEAQVQALNAIARMAKFSGVDVLLVGGARLEPMADKIVSDDTGARDGTPSAGDEVMGPFERAKMSVPSVDEIMAMTGWSKQQAKARIHMMKSHDVWANNIYQVNIAYAEDRRMAHLIIRRHDRQPVHSWPHFQQIKNELIGEECEAVELYPAERDLVDAKEHYHLWAFTSSDDTFGIGFKHGREVKGKRG